MSITRVTHILTKIKIGYIQAGIAEAGGNRGRITTIDTISWKTAITIILATVVIVIVTPPHPPGCIHNIAEIERIGRTAKQ